MDVSGRNPKVFVVCTLALMEIVDWIVKPLFYEVLYRSYRSGTSRPLAQGPTAEDLSRVRHFSSPSFALAFCLNHSTTWPCLFFIAEVIFGFKEIMLKQLKD